MTAETYSIWIVSSPDFVWSHIFDEVAIGLQSAFKTLGYDAPIVREQEKIQGTAIVLGANWMQHLKIELTSDNLIIFNLEQANAESGWFFPESGYLALLKKYPVWDFSRRNIEILETFGIENIVYCPVGYAPELTKIKQLPAAKEDIDVLLVGGHHSRRAQLLQQIAKRGAKVHQVTEAFGDERDAWLSRGKIHLNIHQAQGRLLEIPRVSYLLYFAIMTTLSSAYSITLNIPRNAAAWPSAALSSCRKCRKANPLSARLRSIAACVRKQRHQSRRYS